MHYMHPALAGAITLLALTGFPATAYASTGPGAASAHLAEARVTLNNQTGYQATFSGGFGSPAVPAKVDAKSAVSWSWNNNPTSPVPRAEYIISDGTQGDRSRATQIVINTGWDSDSPITSCFFVTASGGRQSPANGYTCTVTGADTASPIVTLSGIRMP
ncbi:hypothetical protein [Streptomyces sp. NRRL F-2664]|uniref:hypothetical protein n=1 Tax=Streptomyces sp. NRRL F-2664 TaxID=1463842 RepID=UPI00131BDF55|nr:hypothetical protein [Streptomyces sp. NRRL F-2664]